MANENTPMSIVAVPAWQLSPTLFQTRSFGILFGDSDFILRKSKLCGRANPVAVPLRESSTFSYFYAPITVKSSVSRFAHCRPSNSKSENSDVAIIHGYPGIDSPCQDGRKRPNVTSELVPEPINYRNSCNKNKKTLAFEFLSG